MEGQLFYTDQCYGETVGIHLSLGCMELATFWFIYGGLRKDRKEQCPIPEEDIS